jgi:hypothetical protein
MRCLLLALVPACLSLGIAPPPSRGCQDPGRDARVVERALQLAKPAAQHELLARLAGEWDVQMRSRLPNGEWSESRARVDGSLMLGGRYVSLQFRMQLREREVQAVQILGFDTLRQVFTSSWRDELSTWSVECSGPPVDGSTEFVRCFGTVADASDPAGRPFRLDVDLGQKDVVGVQVFETRGESELVAQSQQWKRR